MAKMSKAASMNYTYSIYGLALVLIGWMLYSGSFSLEQGIGVWLVLMGLKKLLMSSNCC
jgi:hypothetical protein